jgi:DNA-binding transcriptional ArsR family regulator
VITESSMALKVKIGTHGILISAIVLTISVLLLIDRLLATGPVQLILEDGRAVPIEGASYFSLNDVLFFIITAWLGGMSFLYMVLSPKEKEVPDLKENPSGIIENKNTVLLAASMLEGDEKTLLQQVIDSNDILQRELVLKTGFSEPKVSRLLDKLERRGLILRRRDGMGNRISLKNG